MRAVLTRIYSCLTSLEREFFNFFKFLSFRPTARVISVGNLTMGGTGKTPVLFELLEELQHRQICVLTRGYRSPWERSFYQLIGEGPHPAAMTDEALLGLASRLSIASAPFGIGPELGSRFYVMLADCVAVADVQKPHKVEMGIRALSQGGAP